MGQIPLFNLLSNRMHWLSSRQSVLAENVANTTTPNYVARDLKPMDFARELAGSLPPGLRMTNTRHMVLSSANTPFEVQNAAGEAGNPLGTVVSLEQEMIKLSDTRIQYQTAANLYQKTVGMFRTALGGRAQ